MFQLCSFTLTFLLNPGLATFETPPIPKRGKNKKRKKAYCETCNIDKWDGVQHCNHCGVCIQDMDHHCPWSSKCIGKGNQVCFYFFLWSTLLLMFYMVGVSFMYLTEVVTDMKNHHEKRLHGIGL